jgi:hypothetical protein
MNDKPYKDITFDELLEKMRGYPVEDMRYAELRAEMERRIMTTQMKANVAQINAAWLQFAAVIAMFLTVLATVAAPFLARH